MTRPGLIATIRAMNAIVVYESHWGNTAAVARAIAEGIGPAARALHTDEAAERILADVDLLVVGAPVIAFGLPRESMRAQIAAGADKAPTPPDISHPLIRTWLGQLPPTHAACAAFETRIWWSPRGATGSIEAGLRKAGCRVVAKAERFIVAGAYGPLKDGELDRAREWGRALATKVGG